MISVHLITMGHIPVDLDISTIKNWNSEVFHVENISSIGLHANSDRYDHSYSDDLLSRQISNIRGGDFSFIIVNVPLEDNWYSRRIADNFVVFTLHEIKEILEHHDVPLENIVLRMLYCYSFLCLRNDKRLPSLSSGINFTHSEARGCIYDFNGIKSDIHHSCDNPIICDECTQNLRKDNVSEIIINHGKKEIKKIRRTLYYRIVRFMKKKTHRIFSILHTFGGNHRNFNFNHRKRSLWRGKRLGFSWRILSLVACLTFH